MMLPIRLGTDLDTNEPVILPPEAMARHIHLPGATGGGKTVALHTLLRPIMSEPRKRRRASVFIIDPIGGLSRDTLMWIASPKCPQHVRDRLVYIEVADNAHVVPFNPLKDSTLR